MLGGGRDKQTGSGRDAYRGMEAEAGRQREVVN
jgi:hypothetical protein